MWKYVLKRLGLAILTLFIILSLSFLLIKLLPFEKPVGTIQQQYSYYLSQVSLGFAINSPIEVPEYGTPLAVIDLGMGGGVNYFYQAPIMQQYFNWMRNMLTKFDWGVSTYINPNNSAWAIIASKMPLTIKINFFATIFSVPLGILIGIFAALKKNKPVDHVISTSIMIFVSIPSFVLITLFMSWFCYKTGWLPTQWPSSMVDTATRIKGYIIPVLCLSFGSIAGYARFVRAELCEVMSSEYLLLARTKGLTKKQAIIRHALKNAMVPIVPSILAEVIGLLSGSMILEQLYGIPGTGQLYVIALNQKDYSVLFVDMALYTAIGLFASVFLDISYGFIDPRIRMGAKK